MTEPSDFTQFASGKLIAQADRGGKATVTILQVQAARQIDASDLETARQRLTMLPLDTIPELATLPFGSHMPLRRNPHFVGRERALRFLGERFSSLAAPLATIAVTGLGGLGKTQLASEFVHRYGAFFAGGVFWLRFAEPDTVPLEAAACGGLRALEVRPDFDSLPLEEQIRLVRAIWDSPMPLLLVFDNCEDPDLLEKWRPVTGGSRILITSRRGHWEAALGIEVLRLDVLSRQESTFALHHYRRDLLVNDPALVAIADELGDLPLALHLAGSFLEQYRYAVTPNEYLAQLRGTTPLQHHSMESSGISPTQHELSIARTFSLSYDRLDSADRTDQRARALLSRTAHFAPGTPIPRSTLLATISQSEDDPQAILQDEDALSRLVTLGLLETDDTGALRLHRLLASFTRMNIDPFEATAAQRATENVLFKVTHSANKSRHPEHALPLLPHLKTATEAAAVREDQDAARLCFELGHFLHTLGDYSAAVHYMGCALAITRMLFPEFHPETANMMSSLGVLLHSAGDFPRAEKHLEYALVIREAILAESDPAIGQSVYSLGLLLKDLGNFPRAMHYLKRALVIQRAAQPPDNMLLALVLNSLGSVLQHQRRFHDAVLRFAEALALQKTFLPGDHPDTASTLNNLGMLDRELKRYVTAREYLDQALAIHESTLGKQHPNTATILNNIGMVLTDEEKYFEARGYFERALAIQEANFGEQPEVAGTLSNLGSTLIRLKESDAGYPYLQRALEILETKFGRYHHNLGSILNAWGTGLYEQGDFEQARLYWERALAIRQATLGSEHPLTENTLNNLRLLHEP